MMMMMRGGSCVGRKRWLLVYWVSQKRLGMWKKEKKGRVSSGRKILHSLFMEGEKRVCIVVVVWEGARVVGSRASSAYLIIRQSYWPHSFWKRKERFGMRLRSGERLPEPSNQDGGKH